MYDLDISVIAGIVHKKLGTITDPKYVITARIQVNSGKNVRKMASVLSLWLPHGLIPVTTSPLHANDGSLFIIKPLLGAPCGPQDNNPGS